MESINSNILLAMSQKQLLEWFNQRDTVKIYLPIKKTTIGKNKGMANQTPFAHSLRQKYAMWKNYETCISEESPMMIITKVIESDRKDKAIMILGLNPSKSNFNNFAISINEVPKNKEIHIWY